MSAVEIRSDLEELYLRRAVVAAGSAEADTAVLDEQIVVTRAAYIGTALTELATLRAELFGPQVG